MKTLPEILKHLTVNTGDEYHRLHTGKQAYELTDAHMSYYENKAAEAIAKELMGCLPEKLELDYIEDLENHPLYTTYSINIEDCIKGHNKALDEVRSRLIAFIGKEK